MVYTRYTLKPRLENKQTIFSTLTLKLYIFRSKYRIQPQNVRKKNAIFPPTAQKGAFFRKPTDIKKRSNRQTDRL